MVASLEIREGFKDTEVGIIPCDWLLFSIEELTPRNRQNTIVDGPFGSNLKTIHYRKSGIPIITSGYVTDGKFFAIEYLFVDLEKFKQEKRSAVKGGDIVMAKIGERCGASAILPKEHPEGILSGNALKISIDENRFSTELVAQILWWHHTKGDFEILRTTGAQPALSMANLKKYKIPLPTSKDEQDAIATTLSDTDKLIAKLEQLIAKKRNIKQGAMQELLKPKEGWVEKKLGDCLKRNPDYGINAAAISFNESMPVYLRITDITEDGKYSKNNIVSVGNISSINYYLEKGDLVFARTGASVGKTYLYNPKDGRLVFAGFLIRVIANPEYLLPEYFKYFTQTKKYWDWIRTNSMRTGQPGINGNEYKELPINLPPSIEEQKRITIILMDMDNEIEVLEMKLRKYKLLKQGMMQNLLTGKIRLV